LQVLREYQRRDGLMSQLLTDRDQLRREASRSAADAARAEKQRAEAQRAVERAKVSAGNEWAAERANLHACTRAELRDVGSTCPQRYL
jgi:hypothetical protein